MEGLRGKIDGRRTDGPVGWRRGDASEALRCRGVGCRAAAVGAGAMRVGASGCDGAGVGGGWGVRELRGAVEVFGFHRWNENYGVWDAEEEQWKGKNQREGNKQ